MFAVFGRCMFGVPVEWSACGKRGQENEIVTTTATKERARESEREDTGT